jgi:CubicO group peptidase (beta-lactamase class C family)
MKTVTLILLGFYIISNTYGQINEIEVSKKTDELLTDAINKGIFSGVVIISKDGKQIYKKQYGYADWNTKRPIDDNTLYNIGSLNKQFTEEMIHQLEKEGKLKYDDLLAKYLSLFPTEPGNKITIQQLVEMSSGLGDYMMNPAFREISNTDFRINDVLNIIKTEPLLFDPGTGKRYSNSGFVVLGALIEKITGKSYEENLRSRIAEPLGLKNICYTKAEKSQRPDRAFGTRINFDGMKSSIDDITNSLPDGSIYTDEKDLLTFIEAKRTGHMPSGEKYGEKGMFAGGTQTWNSLIGYNSSGFSLVIMANVGTIADELGSRIRSIMKGETYPPLDLPFEMKLYKIANEKGIGWIENHVRDLAQQANRPYDDRFLNFFGYRLMEGGETGLAIQIFTLNVKLFPRVPNCYDSLAEAYLKTGDKKNAKKYYSELLKLDPANQQVKDLLENLP